MNARAIFERITGVASEPSQEPLAPQFSGRDALREALAARHRAQSQVDAETASVARIVAVVGEGRAAELRYSEADAQARTAMAKWAEDGCDTEAAGQHADLADAAAALKAIAERQAPISAAAGRGLIKAREKEADARRDLRAADFHITSIIGRIFADEIQPQLEARLAAAEAYRAAHLEIEGLTRFFSGERGYASTAASSVLAAAEARAEAAVAALPAICDFRTGELLPGSGPLVAKINQWRERAEILRQDPES